MDMEEVVETSCSESSNSSNRSSYSSSYNVLTGAVDKTIHRITLKTKIFSYIKEHFQPVYRADSKDILMIYKSMMAQLTAMIKEEIDVQLKASNVQEYLSQLDKIKEESVSSEQLWRPSGNPQEDMKVHVQDESEFEVKQLEEVLSTLLSQNKKVNRCVQLADSGIKETMKKIEEECHSWEEAASMMTDTSKQVLVEVSTAAPWIVKKQDV